MLRGEILSLKKSFSENVRTSNYNLEKTKPASVPFQTRENMPSEETKNKDCQASQKQIPVNKMPREGWTLTLTKK